MKTKDKLFWETIWSFFLFGVLLIFILFLGIWLIIDLL